MAILNSGIETQVTLKLENSLGNSNHYDDYSNDLNDFELNWVNEIELVADAYINFWNSYEIWTWIFTIMNAIFDGNNFVRLINVIWSDLFWSPKIKMTLILRVETVKKIELRYTNKLAETAYFLIYSLVCFYD